MDRVQLTNLCVLHMLVIVPLIAMSCALIDRAQLPLIYVLYLIDVLCQLLIVVQWEAVVSLPCSIVPFHHPAQILPNPIVVGMELVKNHRSTV
jgi:hypothetical protein